MSYKVDVSNEKDLQRVFGEIQERFGTVCAAAIFNASSRPFPKPFLWQSQSDLDWALSITLCAESCPLTPLLHQLLTGTTDTEPAPFFSPRPRFLSCSMRPEVPLCPL